MYAHIIFHPPTTRRLRAQSHTHLRGVVVIILLRVARAHQHVWVRVFPGEAALQTVRTKALATREACQRKAADEIDEGQLAGGALVGEYVFHLVHHHHRTALELGHALDMHAHQHEHACIHNEIHANLTGTQHTVSVRTTSLRNSSLSRSSDSLQEE